MRYTVFALYDKEGTEFYRGITSRRVASRVSELLRDGAGRDAALRKVIQSRGRPIFFKELGTRETRFEAEELRWKK